MSDWMGTNLDLDDFENLLQKEDLVEEPVPIQVFVQDRKYLGQPPLSEIQLEIARHITQVLHVDTLQSMMGEKEGYDYFQKYTVNEVIAQLGKGSGKDHVSRISLAYLAYMMHCLRDPLGYYGKANGVYIDLVNLAVNAKQAQQVFFDPLKNLLLASPWASDVGFEPRVQEIFWFSRPVRMFSGHSESEGWEGYEVMSVILDEISAFKTSAEIGGDLRNKGSADQIYEMARASVSSRFPREGKVILLSFPRFKGDFIQQRYKSVIDDVIEQGGTLTDERMGNKGLEREERAWAVKAATWEVNPTRHREEFESEFKRNPVQAAARFECNPPAMEDAYFRDPDRVRLAFNQDENPENEDGTYKQWFNGTDGIPRFIHVDLGLKKDRTGLAVVHSPGIKQIKTPGGTESLPVVRVDYVTSWQAAPNEEIDFSSVRETILMLARKFDVALVTFDNWNSADMIQALRSKGVNVDSHTVRKQDYDTLSTAIYDGRLSGYWHELLVEEELLKLRLITNTKVDHPNSGSKDLADAVAGATYNCLLNVHTDAEIEIEWLTGVDYDEFTIEDSDRMIEEKISTEKRKVEPTNIPQEIQEWLIEMI